MTDVRIVLGSVFAPPDDPVTRLLVARQWPRGVVRGAVDQWEPQLGPASALDDLDAARFAEAYRAQLLARPSLLDWAARMATNNGVALLCASPEATHLSPEAHLDQSCHVATLAEVLRERIAAA